MTDKKQQAEMEAQIISVANGILSQLDIEFCKQAGLDMKPQASRQESMLVLNPSHSNNRTKRLRAQGEAMLLLTAYIEKLKEADSYLHEAENDEQRFRDIQKMFL